MSKINAIAEYFTPTNLYDYKINQSLRFEEGDNPYLERDIATTGDTKKWTISCWVKRHSPGSTDRLFSQTHEDGSGSDLIYIQILFNSSDQLVIADRWASLGDEKITTTAKFRDPSAWYHIVFVRDSDNATQADRAIIYVNGERQAVTGSYTQSKVTSWNRQSVKSYAEMNIGRLFYNTAYYNDTAFQMAEVHNIDGAVKDPTDFAESKNGIWIAKKYTGSYGTNGFYLDFADGSALGDDESGNGNDFTSSGVASTDVVLDSPTNNFSTLNPLATDYLTPPNYAEGNLEFISVFNYHKTVFGSMGVTTGKWYFEGRSHGGNKFTIGLTDVLNMHYQQLSTTNAIIGYTPSGLYAHGDAVGLYAGTLRKNGSTVASSLGYATGDKMGIAFDADAGKVWFHRNGTWHNGSGTDSTTLDPDNHDTTVATGEIYVPAFSAEDPTGWYVNFGADGSFAGTETSGGYSDANGNGDFFYEPPAGFLALCSDNLPEPSISPLHGEQPADYFNTVLYTGNGTAGTGITGVGFQPDWVWIKARSDSYHHMLTNSVSGVGKRLSVSQTAAESSDANAIDSFDSDGFTLDSGSSINNNSDTYVAWSWLAGGTAVSNTDGAITSSVSANTTAGFSVGTFTKGSGTQTVGHGLGKKPTMIWVKRTNGTGSWFVYHDGNTSAPETDYLRINSTNATTDDSTVWGDTAPTDSVFTISTAFNSGEEMVFYAFTDIEGYSKMGKHEGNTNAKGVFSYMGFRPAFLLVKSASSSGDDWFIFDTARQTYNPAGNYLRASAANAEASFTALDFVSNGIKYRASSGAVNDGSTFVYMAFAEQPFKYANAR
jgi:hypothetical protein